MTRDYSNVKEKIDHVCSFYSSDAPITNDPILEVNIYEYEPGLSEFSPKAVNFMLDLLTALKNEYGTKVSIFKNPNRNITNSSTMTREEISRACELIRYAYQI